MPKTPNLHPNVAAFLDTIAWCEGTSSSPNTYDDGYDIEIGGTPFSDYSQHPFDNGRDPLRINKRLSSTAAGRYQVLRRYWEAYKHELGLPDFGPLSQDRIALQMLRECGAYALLRAGDLEGAVAKANSRWASLPGSPYGQHTFDMETVRKIYVGHGGYAD